ncbi:hypothetical protein IB286_15080 [Spongiibacter sp. KMU-158]|uniref:Tyr recombinase domain-containing protein n=1 Tax=Spongiibacter pelagi TaxID=2760804 RepID=A0A927C536_9GAMM|nr:hypothetical protein [Spongiibacter pelagi]MBD2860318.1 hypothetical protein [Spongiibacter pelagi]
MTKQLEVSALDYCRTIKLDELDSESLNRLPISSYKLPDGTHQVLSEYGDMEWRYENDRFVKGVKDGAKKISFKSIPPAFVEPLKYAVKQYDIKMTPAGGTLCYYYKNIKPFLAYLDCLNIQAMSVVTPFVAASYVQHSKEQVSLRGKPLSVKTLVSRFSGIELLYKYLKGTPWEFEHPWPESSSVHLGGLTGTEHSGKKTAKTEVISDEELKIVVSHCEEILDQAPELITLAAEIARVRRHEPKERQAALLNALLSAEGFTGLREFNAQYNQIGTATAIIILTFSGIRIHELLGIQNNAYRIEDNEDEVLHWLKSYSSKTNEGYTEWLSPEIVIKAVKVRKAFNQPLQDALLAEQASLFEQDPYHPRALAIEGYKDNLFLAKVNSNGGRVELVSTVGFDKALKRFGNALGVPNLASHRFRRTFAVYVATSAYGDLRYLKKHFKHWSMDMTLLYAFNDHQSEELYDEIAIEIKNYKVARVDEFLEEDTIITGGLADKLISYRSSSEAVRTFSSRAEMAEKISDTIHLRSTGHSWCTSDNSGCGGRSSIESTRCVECKDSIIEKDRHGEYFNQLHLQQIELLNIDDIGPVGKQRVERDLRRCESVLRDLGLFDGAASNEKEIA